MKTFEPARARVTAERRTKSWWERNWKWFLPTVCLSFLALVVAFALIVMSAVFFMMRSSDVYTEAMARVRSTPAVVEAIGEPVTEAFFLSGSMKVDGPSGSATIEVPISGPKGRGAVFIEAKKAAGLWTYSTLEVRVVATGERIDLR